MAVAHVATGARGAGGTTSVTVAYPAGVAAGRLAVIGRVIKPSTATGLTPAGYVNRADATGGTGAAGNDVGQTRVIADTRLLDGSETGTVACTQATSPNSAHGLMLLYSVSAGAGWDIAATTGADNTHGTGRAATGGALPLAPGDVVVAVIASDTDTITNFTTPAITASGITFGAATIRVNSGGVGTGQDTGLHVVEATVTAGTGNVAPSLSLSAGPSNCGPVAFVRLRQTASTITVPQVTEAETAAFPRVVKSGQVVAATETEVAENVTPGIVHATVDVDWRAGDLARFTKALFSADGSATSSQAIDTDAHRLDWTVPVADTGDDGGSNLREVLVLDETSGWRDGHIATTFGPKSLFGLHPPLGQSYIPQHGIGYRYQDDGTTRRMISIWQNVVFNVNTNMLIGVWKSNSDGSGVANGFLNRQLGQTMPLLSRGVNFSGATRTGGVVTATATSSTDGFFVGDPVGVSFPNEDFDGRFFLTDVTSTTMKWADSRADGSAAGGGGASKTFPYDVEYRVHGSIVDLRAWPPENPGLKPEWTNWDPSAGIDFPGTSGSYIDTPDHADYDNFAGDLVLWCDFTPAVWPPTTNQTLIGRYTTATGDRHFRLFLRANTGIIGVQLSQNGAFTNADWSSSVAPTLVNGRICIWAEADIDNGAGGKTCSFYQAPTVDDYDTRTALGTPHTVATALPSINSAADTPIELGSFNAGAADIYAGRIHAAGVRAGLTGTPYVDVHMGQVPNGATSFNDRSSGTGKSWALHGSCTAVNQGFALDQLAFSADIDVPGVESSRTEAYAPTGSGKVAIIGAHVGKDPNSKATFGPVFATNAPLGFVTAVLSPAVETETAFDVTAIMGGSIVDFAATVDAVADLAGAVARARPVAAAVEVETSVTGTVDLAVDVAATVDAVAETVAAPSRQRAFAVDMPAVAAVAADLSKAGQVTFAAAVDAVAVLAATVARTETFAGPIETVAALAGELGRDRAVAAAVDALAAVAADITTTGPITGTVELAVTVAATRTRSSIAAAATTRDRSAAAAGTTRLGADTAPTRGRSQSTVSSTRNRDRGTVAATRPRSEASTAGTTRTGATVGPTRVER